MSCIVYALQTRREAFVSVFDNGTNSCYEAVVALDNIKPAEGLLQWNHIPGVQPTLTVDECKECE